MSSIQTNRNAAGQIISYRVRICVGRDASGRQIWRSTTLPRPQGLTPVREQKEIRRQAEEWERLTRQRFAAQAQPQADPAPLLFCDFVERFWLPRHVHNGSHTPEGVAFYEYTSRRVCDFFRGERLAAVDTAALQRYLVYLRTQARTQNGTPLAPRTVQHHFNTLRSILKFAYQHGFIAADPLAQLPRSDLPPRVKNHVIFLTPEQARRFLQCLQQEPLQYRCLITLLLCTGLRRGEAVGLQWGDIDPVRLQLAVVRGVTQDPRSAAKLHIGTTKTGAERTVPLTPALCRLLAQWQAEQQRRFGPLAPDMFVFCSKKDPYRPLYPTTPTSYLYRFEKKYGLPPMSPHDLRHTAATLALEAGGNIRQVQLLLGHTDPAVTMAFYAGVTEQAQRRTVERLEALLYTGEPG